MSALDDLNVDCRERGWRLALTGTSPGTERRAGLRVGSLEVRGCKREGARELLATAELAGVSAADYQAAALAAATTLGLAR